MRSHCICILLLSLQCLPLSFAAGRFDPEPDPVPVEPVEPIEPAAPYGAGPGAGPNNIHAGEPEAPAGIGGSSPKANVPGAIYEGDDPEVSSADEEVDINEIADKLHDLVDDISSLVGARTTSTTTTDANGSPTVITAISTITSAPITDGASYCTQAQSAYDVCSSSNANFTALPRTQQAGCLCNAQPSINFNQDMYGCYSWAYYGPSSSNSTQLRSYASVIANATSLCQPCPQSTMANGLPNFNGGDSCAASASIPAAATPTPTSGPLTGSASERVDGSMVYLLMAAFWVGLASVIW